MSSSRIRSEHSRQIYPETTPDDFPDLDIPDTLELNNFDDVDYASRDDEWVKRWRAFTGDGLTGDADDEIPTPSLSVDVKLPTLEAGDNYVNASLMLPLGNSLARGTVINWLKMRCLRPSHWERKHQCRTLKMPTSLPRVLRESGLFLAPNLNQMLRKALSLCAHSMV